ncbi:hypothetical protein BDV18DRAFT_15113 [Aspergillus unguis]
MPLIQLTPDEIDDLIYSVRVGDNQQLETDLAALSEKYQTKHSVITASAVDSAPESEGGSGCSLLHYPAANGNEGILQFLITNLMAARGSSTEETLTEQEIKNALNWKNHSGNTALHWAALNMHLGCVKLLLDAGADVSIKNEAGHDAAFLAERADWKAGEASQTQAEQGGEDEDEEMEVEVGTAEGDAAAADAGPKTKAREVVECILSYGEATPAAQGSASEEL